MVVGWMVVVDEVVSGGNRQGDGKVGGWLHVLRW